MLLTLHNIRYTYPGSSAPALNGVSVTFSNGWCGIAGDNGCGKSTLARIACDALKPDAGTVAPAHTSVYCPQDAQTPPDLLEDFACDWSREAVDLRKRLDIHDDMLWRFESLSYGERKKIQVATALWQNPHVLVLDEPTNHVDARCREALAKTLRTYRGVGLLISHDRALLNGLVECCLAFEGERWVMRPGTYDQARNQHDREQAEAAARKTALTRQAARLTAEADARAHTAARTAARLSGRNLDKHDSDGREKRRLAVYSGQDGKTGALASGMDARAQRAHAEAQRVHVAKRYDGSLWLDAKPHPRPTLLFMDEHAIPCGAGLLHVPKLAIGNTSRIGIEGPNGGGKSTLVNHLLAHLPRDVSALVVSQEISPAQASAVLQNLHEADPQRKGRLLSIVTQLNSNAKRVLEGDGASPGEVRKLMLAQGVLDKPALIVMDEPTNHLDLHSAEALEQALAGYPGALVVVSHDHDFLDACTTVRWLVDEGKVTMR